jgi:predicted transcriptional regulator
LDHVDLELPNKVVKKRILDGWEIKVWGDIANIPDNDLIHLIQTLGARVIGESTDFTKENYQRVVLIDSIEEVKAKQARKYLAQNQVAILDKEWLLETMCSWTIRKLIRYTPVGISFADLNNIGGYPASMIGERD